MRKLTVVFVTILAAFAKTGCGLDFGYSDIEDLLQIGGPVKITELSKSPSARNLDNSIEDSVESFIKNNEITMEAPFGMAVSFNGRSLANDEFDLKLRLGSGSQVEGRKKKKIKRVLAPILIILLLKAITLIPLALGILGIKTWNALQLSFVSFVTAVVMAVWKLCAKFSDHHHVAPTIIHEAVHDVHVPHVYHDSHHDHVVHHDYHDDHVLHHDLWDHHHHHRSDDSQQMAYSGYAPEKQI